MTTVSVPAIRPFEHDGRPVDVGDWISLTPIQAAALSYQGLVSLLAGEPPVTPVDAPTETPMSPQGTKARRARRATGTKRTNHYRRKDLRAAV